MINYKGKWAVITGASSGIGEVFAKQLAERGTNLVLVARNEAKLKSLAQEISKHCKVEVDVVPTDLSKPTGPEELYKAVQRLKRPIRILINNAGFGSFGKFEKTPLQKNQEMILVNTYAVASLAQLFLPEMVQAHDGIIVNVASTAAFQPVPYLSNYSATKAFVLSLSEALWAENREAGVRVLALCPGPTETSFFEIAGSQDTSLTKMDSPLNVVQTAFRALEKNRSYVIPGPKSNYFLAQAGRLGTRALVARITERMLRQKGHLKVQSKSS